MLAVVETVAVMWWYGVENFCNDLEFMLKRKVGVYWRICWGIVTPSLLIIIFVYFLVTISRLTYGTYEIADAALICGWLIVAVAFFQFVCFIVRYVFKNRESGFPEMICDTFTPTGWGPKNNKRLEEWSTFKKQKEEEVAAKGETWFRHKMQFLIGR